MKKLIEKINSAIENKDVAFLSNVIYKNKVDLNMPINKDEDTFLIWSIKNNLWQLIRPLLLNKQVDINKVNLKNETALSEMVFNVINSDLAIEEKQKYSQLVQTVLYRKDINANNGIITEKGDVKTPWMFVYDSRNKKSAEENAVVEELAQTFAKKNNLVDEFGINELMYACQIGDEKLVDKVLQFGYYDINAQDEFGYTALQYAVITGNENIVNRLLNVKDIDINIVNKNNEDAFLISCAFFRKSDNETRFKIANRLLQEKEVNVNTQDKFGNFPLYLTYYPKNLKLFNNIISRFDLDLSKENDKMIELLTDLMYSGDYATLNKIVNSKNINKLMVEKVVLSISIKENDIKMIDKILAAKEFDINTPVAYGYFDTALADENFDILRKFTKHNTFKPAVEDENGANAFGHIFSQKGNHESDVFGSVCSLIMDECSVGDIEELLNNVDENGNDALMNAIINNYSSSHIEVFLANIKKHFGYVEIDTTKQNKDGKTLVDLIQEVSVHKEEVEINRLVKIFKDYKNANVVKDKKEKNTNEETVELDPVVTLEPIVEDTEKNI